jgi:hypothetical protein
MAKLVMLDSRTGERVVMEKAHREVEAVARKMGRAYAVLTCYSLSRIVVPGHSADHIVQLWRAGQGKGVPTTVLAWEMVGVDAVEGMTVAELKASLTRMGKTAKGKKADLAVQLVAALNAQKADALAAEGMPVKEWEGAFWNCTTLDKNGDVVPCPAFAKGDKVCKHVIAAGDKLGRFSIAAFIGLQVEVFRNVSIKFLNVQKADCAKAQGRPFRPSRRTAPPSEAAFLQQ